MNFETENAAITMGRIIARSLSNTMTPAEQHVLDDWLKDPAHRQIYNAIRDGAAVSEAFSAFGGFHPQEGYRQFIASVQEKQSHSARLRVWRTAAAAAAILAFLTIAITIHRMNNRADKALALRALTTDIEPGGNRATLRLANGRTIRLDESRSGIVVKKGQVTYADGSSLAEVGNEGLPAAAPMMELSTPKGGTYQVTLPDGTEVWLNAASTLKYPARFDDNERIVELEGEAYFEVRKSAVPAALSSDLHSGRKRGETKQQSRSFKVLTADQVVEVLGTEFNVSAYTDESQSKTTLLEGSVRVSSRSESAVGSADYQASIIIRPGEQAIVSKHGLNKIQVNVASVAAWKSGKFDFNGKPLPQVMKEVSRWYDLEVVYEGGVPQGQLVGDAYRNQNLSLVLDMLDVLEIDYSLDVQNRKLTIFGTKGGTR